MTPENINPEIFVVEPSQPAPISSAPISRRRLSGWQKLLLTGALTVEVWSCALTGITNQSIRNKRDFGLHDLTPLAGTVVPSWQKMLDGTPCPPIEEDN